MILGSRSSSILKILSASQGRSDIKTLARTLNLTERAIRYELEKIDDYLKFRNWSSLERKFGGDIFFKDFLSYCRESDTMLKDSSLDAGERKKYMFFKILFEEKINLTKICDELDISRTTIKNNLKSIKEELDNSSLFLKPFQQEGLILSGSESDIRKHQLKFLRKYSDVIFYNSSPIKTKTEKLIIEYFSDLSIENIKTFINYIQKSMNKIISDEAYNLIAIYILSAVKRIKKGHLIEEVGNRNFLMETDEYKTVLHSKSIIESHYDIEIKDEEILQITDYFLGSHTYNFEQSYYRNWIEIDILVKKLISKFSKHIDVDITKDKILLEGIINHIKPTIYRIKNKLKLENSIYIEVMNSYPNIFYLTKLSVKDIEEYIGSEFSHDEIAFLAIYFKSAIDRNKYRNRNLKRILLVCGHGYGISKLLAQQLKESYTINIVQTIPRHLLEKTLEKEDIDLIISTMDIEEKFEVPVVRVNSILTSEDIDTLDRFALPKQRKKFMLSDILGLIEKNCEILSKENLISDLNSYFEYRLIDDSEQNEFHLADLLKKKNILLNYEADSWEEAIRAAGNILLKNSSITEEYIGNMIDNVKKFGPYIVIGNGAAIPHAKNDSSVIKTDMALITLKNEVAFPYDKNVSIVLAFCSADGQEHLTALSELMELITSYDFIEAAKKIKRIDEIIKYLVFDI